MYTVHIGENKTDNFPEKHELTLEKIYEYLTEPRLGEKDGLYIMTVVLEGDGRRAEKNVTEISGFFLDFDKGVDEFTIKKHLSGVEFFAHTTFSHTSEKPRWRVFIPYEKAYPSRMHKNVYWDMVKRFDGYEIDPRCKTASQLWYTPTTNDPGSFRYFRSAGKFLNPSKIKPTKQVKKEKAAPKKEVGLWLPKGNRDNDLLQEALRLRNDALMPEDATLAALKAIRDKHTEKGHEFTDTDLKRVVRSAYRPEYDHRKEKRSTPVKGETFKTLSGPQIMKQGAALPPIKWIVQDILPEGACLLVGSPKIGKSFFALNIAIAVAKGQKALGEYATEGGEVLYLAVDDRSLRRFYGRANIMKVKLPSKLHASFEEPPRMGEGFEEFMENWHIKRPKTVLVVVDIYGQVAPVIGPNSDSYQMEGDVGRFFIEMSERFGVSYLVLHHDRKAISADVMDSTRGTKGLTGGFDGAMFLNRERGQMDAQLTVVHRDVMGDPEIALELDDTTGLWKTLGDAYIYKKSKEQTEMWKYFTDYPEKQTVKEIAERRGLRQNSVSKILSKLVADKSIQREKIGKSFVYWNGYQGKQDVDK